MRALVDTHALLWWVADSARLSETARAVIADDSNDIFVSAASAWELATKFRLGKLPGGERVAADVVACIPSQGFLELGISVADGERAGRLAGAHRDPFDRMLIAQALAHDLRIVSVDRVFDDYVVDRVW